MFSKLKKLYLIFIIILLLLFTISCSSSKKGDNNSNTTTKYTDVQNDFHNFTEELFVKEIQANTINLHYTLSEPENYNIKDYPITLGDYSVEYFEKNNQDIQNTFKKLTEFNYDDLSDNQQLIYDILYEYLVIELSYSDLYLYSEPLGATLGDQAQLPILLAEYTFNNKKDIDNYLILLSEIDEYFAKLIQFEKDKVSTGLFMSDLMVDGIIEQCSKFIENPEDNYLVAIFNEKVDSLNILSPEDKDLYKEKNLTIVLNDLVNGYKLIISELSSLKGNGINPGGLCNFEKGKEYYEFLIKRNIGTSKSIPELTQTVNNNIKSNLKEMGSIIIDKPDLLNELDNLSFNELSPEDTITKLINNIKDDFPDSPNVNYSFKYVHKSLEDDLSPAFYLIPPIDDYMENVIYINASNKYSEQNLFTTIAHEGYPGHLYQTTYFNSTNPPSIRSLLNYNGYVEGWATYTEIYSYSLSDLNENIADFLALNTSYALGIYSRIDIGVNYDGWTPENVNEYLTEFGITDKNISDDIFNSMVECPGNYLNYYIGYLEILELKDMTKDSLGDDFDLKKFHKFILDTGPAPFNVILKHLNNWIEE